MNLFSGSLFLIAAALLALAGWMVQRYQRSLAIAAYAGFLSALAAIALIQALLFFHPTDAVALMLTRLGYFAGAATFSLLLLFTWHFPIPSQRIPKQSTFWWLLPIVFFFPFTVLNPGFVSEVNWVDGLWKETYGSTFWVFPMFVAVYVIWSLTNLIGKLSSVQGSQRGSMRGFIWTLSLATVLGLVFDVLLPASGRPRIPIGIYSSAVLFGLSTYIVTRK